MQLVNYGNKVFERRKKCVEEITDIVQKYYEIISTKTENVDIIYNSQLNSADFKNLLIDNRKKDLMLKHTSLVELTEMILTSKLMVFSF